MSADQLRRAADRVSTDELLAGTAGSNTTAAVAALLRAAARYEDIAHAEWRKTCRAASSEPKTGSSVDCLACLLDDLAAAYLGEEPQP